MHDSLQINAEPQKSLSFVTSDGKTSFGKGDSDFHYNFNALCSAGKNQRWRVDEQGRLQKASWWNQSSSQRVNEAVANVLNILEKVDVNASSKKINNKKNIDTFFKRVIDDNPELLRFRVNELYKASNDPDPQKKIELHANLDECRNVDEILLSDWDTAANHSDPKSRIPPPPSKLEIASQKALDIWINTASALGKVFH